MTDVDKRYWFVQVGPLDEADAAQWTAQVQQTVDSSMSAELLDFRAWYARALDDGSVRDALVVLRAGLNHGSVPPDVGQSVLGLVSDMETWLEREFDPKG